MADGDSGARRKARETVETAKKAARDALGAAQEGVAEAAETARHQAGKLGDQVCEAAQSLLHDQQQRVADAVHGVADVLRRTATISSATGTARWRAMPISRRNGSNAFPRPCATSRSAI